MKKALAIGALATTVGLTACNWDSSVRSVRAKDAMKYAQGVCQSDPMVGSKSGLKMALEAKREELNSASGSISAERYQALSQELKDYTATAQILHDEGRIKCLRFFQCDYIAKTQSEPVDVNACSKEDQAMTDTSDKIRDLLRQLQQVKPD